MSAETIPSDVATDLDCIRWYVECLDAVAFKRRAVAGLAEAEGSYNAAMKRLTDRSSRPAEPAAPVAEAGDGEVSRYIAKCREMSKGENGHTYTWWSRLADLLSTLEAERARADELRRERDFWENRENEALHRLATAEQRAADALARAEKAERALETAAEDERDRLFAKIMENGKYLLPAHDQAIRQFLQLELATLPANRAAARSAPREGASDPAPATDEREGLVEALARTLFIAHSVATNNENGRDRIVHWDEATASSHYDGLCSSPLSGASFRRTWEAVARAAFDTEASR